jgi:hypothetical protein
VAFNDLHILVAVAAGQSGDMRDGVEASMQVSHPQTLKSKLTTSETYDGWPISTRGEPGMHDGALLGLEADDAAPLQSFLADKDMAKTTSHMTLSVLGEDIMGAVFAFRDGRYQDCVRLIMKRRCPRPSFFPFPLSVPNSSSFSLFSPQPSIPQFLLHGLSGDHTNSPHDIARRSCTRKRCRLKSKKKHQIRHLSLWWQWSAEGLIDSPSPPFVHKVF